MDRQDRSSGSAVDVLVPDVVQVNFGTRLSVVNVMHQLGNVSDLKTTFLQSTERVLVLEYMDGVRLNDVAALNSLGVNKQLLVEMITRCYGHQIYIDGFFNADPHPGEHVEECSPSCWL